ncbi:hypothetical protein BX616_002931 [Lobosporangium transversale]|uniref:FAD-binding domain-containing protein n=1 Tax=Lobosporangium transversale TaxID=64571 RepID=A0A1Y2GWZ9_9FUNG|nr:hypothetical protein BCR41DRAFT_206236 [Lobosporangium transversale]KAF9899616.1 hypothetical protein BX616_002931 [Lobosporangium transversale]ORZ26816.1 hypothetical protein BCR41DRAFT_206236 [Lobosporangium transversale]|eukprot:XP_021884579.1 hypothetical protein BCR41DRAFT_206236 [Lobosporangium transversale]
MDTQQIQNRAQSQPSVIIVGAGLGGLLLGALLERIDVPYQIFERAREIRPLGAAITLGATILPVFEQLGLLEELQSISLPLQSAVLYNADMKAIGAMSGKAQKAAVGYDNILFERPKLYDILLRQVPAHKIHLGKKVLRIEEEEGRVMIHCSDNTRYDGDILVGADGAYSSVRQSLFKNILAFSSRDSLEGSGHRKGGSSSHSNQPSLPKSDQESLSIGYVSLVGVTTPQDPEKYPQLKESFAHFSQVLGKDNRSWGVRSVADYRVCWLVSIQLSETEAKPYNFEIRDGDLRRTSR